METNDDEQAVSTATAGPTQAQQVGDPADRDAVRVARGGVGVDGVGVARRGVLVLGVVDAHHHRGPGLRQLIRRDAGILQRLPGHLQQHPLLRIHRDGLARGDAEEVGVEPGDVVAGSRPTWWASGPARAGRHRRTPRRPNGPPERHRSRRCRSPRAPSSARVRRRRRGTGIRCRPRRPAPHRRCGRPCRTDRPARRAGRRSCPRSCRRSSSSDSALTAGRGRLHTVEQRIEHTDRIGCHIEVLVRPAPLRG